MMQSSMRTDKQKQAGHGATPRAEYVTLAIVCAVALAVRLTAYLVVLSHDPECMMAPDTPSYENTALAFVETGRFAVSPDQPDLPQTIRTPGYPAFIALIYAVVGQDRTAVVIVQIVLSVATVAAMYWLTRTVGFPRCALLVVVLAALDVVSFVYCQILLAETLFTFLLVVGAIGGARALVDQQPKAGWVVLLGLALALGTLVRPISYYLVVPVAIGFFVVGTVTRRTLMARLTTVSLILLPSLVLVGGWQLRNRLVTGSAEFTHIRGLNLLFCTGADIVARRDGISLDEARAKLDAEVPGHEPWLMWVGIYNTDDGQPAELCALYERKGLDLVRQHPWLAIKGSVISIARLLFEPGERGFSGQMRIAESETGPGGDIARLSIAAYADKWLGKYPVRFAAFVFASGYLMLLYAAGAYAAVYLWRKRRHQIAVHIFLLGILVYLALLSGSIAAYSRFRCPIMPFLAMYGGIGLHTLATTLRTRRRTEPKAA